MRLGVRAAGLAVGRCRRGGPRRRSRGCRQVGIEQEADQSSRRQAAGRRWQARAQELAKEQPRRPGPAAARGSGSAL